LCAQPAERGAALAAQAAGSRLDDRQYGVVAALATLAALFGVAQIA